MFGLHGRTGDRSILPVSSWAVWSLPPAGRAVVVTVIGLGVVATALSLLRVSRLSAAEMRLVALLVLLGAVHGEITRSLERTRWVAMSPDYGYHDLSSVWTFAGSLLLPPPAALLVAVANSAYIGLRIRQPVRGVLHRRIYAESTVALGALLAAVVVSSADIDLAEVGGVRELIGVAAAALCYMVVNTGLLAVAMRLLIERPLVRTILDDGLGLEGAAVGLSVLLAVVLESRQPWMAACVLPVLLILHRSVTAAELGRSADAPDASGTLSSGAWYRRAQRAVRAAARRTGVVAFVQVQIDGLTDLVAVHGDLVAQAVLADVLGVIRSTTARDAAVAQQPGGELLLFFTEYTAGAPGLEDRLPVLLGAIEELTLPVHGGDSNGKPASTNLAASAGGARFPDNGLSLEAVVAAAIEAQRRAGLSGGPRWVVADPPLETFRARRSGI